MVIISNRAKNKRSDSMIVILILTHLHVSLENGVYLRLHNKNKTKWEQIDFAQCFGRKFLMGPYHTKFFVSKIICHFTSFSCSGHVLELQGGKVLFGLSQMIEMKGIDF